MVHPLLFLDLPVAVVARSSTVKELNVDPYSPLYWLNVVLASIIVGCFVMLGRLLIRRSRAAEREIHPKDVVRVKNPFRLKLKSDDDTSFTIKTGDLLSLSHSSHNIPAKKIKTPPLVKNHVFSLKIHS